MHTAGVGDDNPDGRALCCRRPQHLILEDRWIRKKIPLSTGSLLKPPRLDAISQASNPVNCLDYLSIDSQLDFEDAQYLAHRYPCQVTILIVRLVRIGPVELEPHFQGCGFFGHADPKTAPAPCVRIDLAGGWATH